ncbi:hypothetical protein E3J68_00135 [Candidatus Aerophobetes bacterium]|uniref:ABC-type glycine betaine transport system substrate-binding domain-containing protein n=1 Tax=Aerophobetes bacterium TaxID=2030807 RepID=A0A523TKU3_UNCAE|nr:MAG: hypothetical protein E3J68_00135 [Candidatus Aerophobetes bacterium]
MEIRRKTVKKKILLILLVLLIAVSLVACAASAEDWKLTLAYSVWPDWEPFIHVAAPLLEEMGYEVTMVDIGGDWSLALEGILAGDIDVVTQASDFCHLHFWEAYRDRLIHLGCCGYGAMQGLAVTPYTDVDTIQELNANVDLFDGEIVGIEAGSGLMGCTADAITIYGLNYTLIEGSTAAMVADRDAAVAKGEDWLGVWWAPFWADVAYPMKMLKGDTELLFGGMDRFYFVARPEFIDEHPAAAQLLMNLTLSYGDYMDIGGWIAVEELSAGEAAAKWLDQNEHHWTKWFPYPYAFPYVP